MANLPMDANKITLIATGKVRPVAVYAERADGSKARVPGAQEKSDFDVPMWQVDVLLDDEDANRAEAITVKVPSVSEPVVPKFQPVTFQGLYVKPYVDFRNGNRLAMSAWAEGIDNGPTSGAAAPAPAAKKASAGETA